MTKVCAVVEVYKKVIAKAISDGYDSITIEDKAKLISEEGAIRMSNVFIDSIMESVSQLIPLMELLSK